MGMAELEFIISINSQGTLQFAYIDEGSLRLNDVS